MKQITISLFVLMASGAAIAGRFSSTIHSIDFGKATEPHLIRFDNSRVSFVNTSDHDLLSSLLVSSEKKEKVVIETDKNNNVLAAQTAVSPDSHDGSEDEKAWSTEPYDPSIVSYNTALNMFKKMRKDYNRSGECYNRAHIWAYEEHQRSGANLMKIFMFFTDRYIRRYRFNWWFHVTPMVYYGNMQSPRTLDRRYSAGPRQTKIWSDIFVKSKRTCRRVNTFNEFWLNQKTEDCYHIHTNMYYVIPRDIEKRDLFGTEKTEFIEREVNNAYQNAF